MSWSRTSSVEQLQDLGADRDVEHRDRLVGDHDLRLRRQRPRHDDALPLPAGELVRVLVGELLGRREPDLSPAARAPPPGPAFADQPR